MKSGPSIRLLDTFVAADQPDYMMPDGNGGVVRAQLKRVSFRVRHVLRKGVFREAAAEFVTADNRSLRIFVTKPGGNFAQTLPGRDVEKHVRSWRFSEDDQPHFEHFFGISDGDDRLRLMARHLARSQSIEPLSAK